MIEPDTDTWIMIRKDHINGVLPEARYKSGLFKWQSLSVPVYTLSAFFTADAITTETVSSG
ncbi:hypothetical protein [Nitrosomonas sp.]|uniref:hypothetical protein n=1 Tax=Nitrosomonas sp. TaxID=42353 RepID=UPI00330560EC